MTREEWATLYVLKYGIAQLAAASYAEGERDFMCDMCKDLELFCEPHEPLVEDVGEAFDIINSFAPKPKKLRPLTREQEGCLLFIEGRGLTHMQKKVFQFRRPTLAILEERGLITTNRSGWCVTDAGREEVRLIQRAFLKRKVQHDTQ